jgi:hypothetical protein
LSMSMVGTLLSGTLLSQAHYFFFQQADRPCNCAFVFRLRRTSLRTRTACASMCCTRCIYRCGRTGTGVVRVGEAAACRHRVGRFRNLRCVESLRTDFS